MSNFNYSAYLKKSIGSVLTQTYSNLELIVVDDGSTDSSLEVLKGFTDPRLKLEFQGNLGQSAAFNRAFALCRGEVICFIDADDWWKPHKVETLVRWHEFLSGNYAVLQHPLEVVDESRKASNLAYRHLPSGDCFEEMRRTGRVDFFVTTTGLSFRRELLKKIFPLPAALRISSDAFLTRAAFAFGPVVTIPEALGCLRIHQSNAGMTKTFDFHQKLRTGIIFPELNAFYEKHKVDYRFSLKKTSRLRRAVSAFLREIRRR